MSVIRYANQDNAPVADAGPDRHTLLGDAVTLNSSGSIDPNGAR